MKSYGQRGATGHKKFEPYGGQDEDDEFEMNEDWHEEEFNENVSHASSRAHQTIVDSQRSTKFQNQLNRETQNQNNTSVRGSSPYRRSAANFNYRVANNNDGQGDEYDEGEEEYEVIGQEIIYEEQFDPEGHKDFKTAYNNLAEIVHSQQQSIPFLHNQEEYEQAVKASEMRKQQKKRADERVKNFQEGKRRKLELIKQENEKKEMDPCTFHPELVARPYTERRDLDQFLAAQRKHEEDKALKRNMMLEHESQMEAGIIHHPEINESSRRMLANRVDGDKPVHERLYGISKNKNKKINQIINESESEFQNVGHTSGGKENNK